MSASPPQIELVVARYEEDLAWTHNIPPEIRLTIYNKGLSPFPHALPLPNHGREAHTYLHHITSRYATLAPLTIFCQGHPFDHCSDFHQVLRSCLHSARPPFQWLGFIIDWDDATGQRLFLNWSKNTAREHLDLSSFCQQVLHEKPHEPFCFYPGAQFILSAETILAQPLSYYLQALAAARHFPHAAHCFERTWDRFFKVPGIPTELKNLPLPLYLKPIKRLQPSSLPPTGKLL
jgi:hypothetical protein